MKRLTIGALFATAAILSGAPAASGDSSSPVTTLPMLNVGEFKPVERLPEGLGPLHALNSDIRHLKSNGNAARLSSALIAALQKPCKKRARREAQLPLLQVLDRRLTDYAHETVRQR